MTHRFGPVLGISLLLSAGGGCDGHSLEPPFLGYVEGNTAYSDGLEVTMVMYNFSWFPKDDSPMPAEGSLYVAALVAVENTSDQPRSFTPASLAWRTLVPGKPGFGPLWEPTPRGRSPLLPGGILVPSESVEGWLTFEVPRGEYADQLVWRPSPGVTLGIDIPSSLVSLRHQYRAVVFGRVSDPTGAPVDAARIAITLVDISVGDEVVGDCRGYSHGVSELESDATGWYDAPLEIVTTGGPFCVDLRVSPPAGRGLGSVAISGRGLIIDQPIPDSEPPELRIDALLPVVN